MIGKTLRGGELRKRFVIEYLKDLHGPAAVQRAGYKANDHSAILQAYRLLKHPEVQAMIKEQLALQRKARVIDANRVLAEVERLALLDVSTALDPETGAVRPIATWPEDLGKCLSGMDIEELYDRMTGEKRGRIVKLRFWDKTKSLDMLGRYLKLWVDHSKLEVTGKDGGPIQTKVDFSGLDVKMLKKLAEGQ